jgi:carbon storage regulator
VVFKIDGAIRQGHQLGAAGLSATAKEWKMLVLSRKKNESIVINNDITIVVVEIRGDKVRLGVEAPKEVPVHRREVYDAIKRHAQDESPAAGSETSEL